MKIGILTHPLGHNYGGILQAYALKSKLEHKGHQVIIIDRREEEPKYKLIIKNILRVLRVSRFYSYYKTNRHLITFTKRHFVRTRPAFNNVEIKKEICRHNMDLIIIGSDQVWRSDFCLKYGYDYWGDLQLNTNSPRLCSYAASLAHDNWTYNKEQTKRIKSLVDKFDRISVREQNAIKLFKDNLGIEAEWLIDPTLLHGSDFYDNITAKRIVKEPYIFVYWLGERNLILPTIEKYSKEYRIIELNLRDTNEKESIEEWLSYIKHADRVITDSFHGIVFSIIFRKQFTAHKNLSGGYIRILSLFEQLDIKEKLEKPEIDLDYNLIDLRICKLQLEADNYIEKCTN